ncbi:uncharacterized protein [Pleurodeles waltl]|uniref:uncharacterized protein n=1 Tax=Pleurodeles waltl TaxID=8319 RepID=UPI0037097D49
MVAAHIQDLLVTRSSSEPFFPAAASLQPRPPRTPIRPQLLPPGCSPPPPPLLNGARCAVLGVTPDLLLRSELAPQAAQLHQTVTVPSTPPSLLPRVRGPPPPAGTRLRLIPALLNRSFLLRPCSPAPPCAPIRPQPLPPGCSSPPPPLLNGSWCAVLGVTPDLLLRSELAPQAAQLHQTVPVPSTPPSLLLRVRGPPPPEGTRLRLIPGVYSSEPFFPAAASLRNRTPPAPIRPQLPSPSCSSLPPPLLNCGRSAVLGVTPDLLLGSELALHATQLHQTVPVPFTLPSLLPRVRGPPPPAGTRLRLIPALLSRSFLLRPCSPAPPCAPIRPQPLPPGCSSPPPPLLNGSWCAVLGVTPDLLLRSELAPQAAQLHQTVPVPSTPPSLLLRVRGPPPPEGTRLRLIPGVYSSEPFFPAAASLRNRTPPAPIRPQLPSPSCSSLPPPLLNCGRSAVLGVTPDLVLGSELALHATQLHQTVPVPFTLPSLLPRVRGPPPPAGTRLRLIPALLSRSFLLRPCSPAPPCAPIRPQPLPPGCSSPPPPLLNGSWCAVLGVTPDLLLRSELAPQAAQLHQTVPVPSTPPSLLLRVRGPPPPEGTRLRLIPGVYSSEPFFPAAASLRNRTPPAPIRPQLPSPSCSSLPPPLLNCGRSAVLGVTPDLVLGSELALHATQLHQTVPVPFTLPSLLPRVRGPPPPAGTRLRLIPAFLSRSFLLRPCSPAPPCAPIRPQPLPPGCSSPPPPLLNGSWCAVLGVTPDLLLRSELAPQAAQLHQTVPVPSTPPSLLLRVRGPPPPEGTRLRLIPGV